MAWSSFCSLLNPCFLPIALYTFSEPSIFRFPSTFKTFQAFQFGLDLLPIGVPFYSLLNPCFLPIAFYTFSEPSILDSRQLLRLSEPIFDFFSLLPFDFQSGFFLTFWAFILWLWAFIFWLSVRLLISLAFYLLISLAFYLLIFRQFFSYFLSFHSLILRRLCTYKGHQRNYAKVWADIKRLKSTLRYKTENRTK